RFPRRHGRGVLPLDRLHAHEPRRRSLVRLAGSARARARARVKKPLGLALTLLAALAALAAPWLSPHDPLQADFAAFLKPPGTDAHPLGTDQLGRDLLARVLY